MQENEKRYLKRQQVRKTERKDEKRERARKVKKS